MGQHRLCLCCFASFMLTCDGYMMYETHLDMLHMSKWVNIGYVCVVLLHLC